MAIDAKERRKAFDLYRQGMRCYTISQTLGRGSATIMVWRDKYKWDERVKKIQKAAAAKELRETSDQALEAKNLKIATERAIIEKYARDDLENLNILKAVKNLCIRAIKAGDGKKNLVIRTAKEAAEIMATIVKTERLIKGESTENISQKISVIGQFSAIDARLDDEIKKITNEDKQT